MMQAGHVTCMGEKLSTHKIVAGKSERGDYLGDTDIDGKHNLKVDVR
jgi:hypothetical protein